MWVESPGRRCCDYVSDGKNLSRARINKALFGQLNNWFIWSYWPLLCIFVRHLAVMAVEFAASTICGEFILGHGEGDSRGQAIC